MLGAGCLGDPMCGGGSRHEELKLVLESSNLWAPSEKTGLKEQGGEGTKG